MNTSQFQDLSASSTQIPRPQISDFITNFMQEINDYCTPVNLSNQYREIQGPLTEQQTLRRNELMAELEQFDQKKLEKSPTEQRLSRVQNDLNEVETQFANLQNLLNCINNPVSLRPTPILTFKCYMRTKISGASERRARRQQQVPETREQPRMSSFEGPRVRFYQQHGLNKINRNSRKIRRNNASQALENSDEEN